jgi:hypothetical protein
MGYGECGLSSAYPSMSAVRQRCEQPTSPWAGVKRHGASLFCGSPERALTECVTKPYYKGHRMSIISLPETSTRSTNQTTKTMNPQYLLCREMQDSIGEANTWPSGIRKLFWTKKMEYWEYVTLSLFAAMNDMPPHLFRAWVSLTGMAEGIPVKANGKKMEAAYEQGLLPPTLMLLPAYNIARRRYENLNGEVMPSSRELGLAALLEQDYINI